MNVGFSTAAVIAASGAGVLLAPAAHADIDRTQHVIDVVREKFPAVREFHDYGCSPSTCVHGHIPGSDHYTRDAVDMEMLRWGTSTGQPERVAAGNEVAAYLVDNFEDLGLDYVIWRDRIYTFAGSGWREYANGCSGPTCRHMDHIHVSTEPGSTSLSVAESDSNASTGGEPGVDPTKPSELNSETYTVVSGDTLSDIAMDYEGVSWQEIFEANQDKIANPDLIYPGEVFEIP